MAFQPSEREIPSGPDQREHSFDIAGMSVETAQEIAVLTGGLSTSRHEPDGSRVPTIYWDSIKLDVSDQEIAYYRLPKPLDVKHAKIVIKGIEVRFDRMDSEGFVRTVALLNNHAPFNLQVLRF